MDYQELVQFINSVGFPICAFGAIFYLYDKTVKELTVAIAKIDTTLKHILAVLDDDNDISS